MSKLPDMNAAVFTPAQISDLTNLEPEVLRNWRMRGFMRNYGLEGENGRWLYSLRDLVAFWIADRLTEQRTIERHQALATGWGQAPVFIAFMTGEASAPHRYVAFIETSRAEEGQMRSSGTELVCSKTLAELERLAFDLMVVIDLQHLADTAPKAIKAAVVGQDDA